MKKLLIATAALAMVAGTAQAQSSVSVYGIMDMSYATKEYTNNGYSTGANGETAAMALNGNLSSSRLGFRGTEDLGGGLKANFTFEMGFAGTQLATTAGLERTAIVGLESASMGRLDLGWDKTASQLIMEKYTAGGANNFIGEGFNFKDETAFNATAATDGALATAGTVNKAWNRPVDEFSDDRVTGLHYKSPKMSGVTVGLTYADNDSKDQDGTASANAKQTLQDISIVYEGIKGLSVGVSQADEKTRAANGTADTKAKVTQFGASYAFGPATVYGQYIDSEAKGTNGAQSRQMDGTQFGVKYAVSPKVTLHAQMFSLDEESTAGTKTFDRKGQQFGAQYAFSKRTTAYVLVGSQESKQLSDGVTNEVEGYAMGVRHSF
jgi:predicted porin